MNQWYNVLLLILCTSFPLLSRHKYQVSSLSIEPQWIDLDPQHTQQFNSKLILVAKIIFKKRSNERITLNQLTLQWNGEPLEVMQASLFKKITKHAFIPLDEALVADGAWNKTEQKLTFFFNEQEHIQPTTVFYLVFTVDDNLEEFLKRGTFSIVNTALPKQFSFSGSKRKFTIAKLRTYKSIPKNTWIIG